MKKTAIVVFLFHLFVQNIFAAKEPMKFGKVDKADLEMIVYSADSSASAVVLCNYGYFDSNNMKFVHQMRIKILKEEGKDRGNFSVPAAEKAIVKGQTVNLENGVPVVTKLNKEGIFIDRVTKDYYRAKVSMPNVKVGSVLDIEFFYTGLPAYWSFQETIPVRWSELILEESTYFSFRKNFVGYNQVHQAETNRWIAKDVASFKSEPYVNNHENYLTRMNIEISSIHIPGTYYKEYATTWESVANTLRDANDFGKELNTIHFYLNDIEKEIKLSTTIPEERMAKAFEAIKKIKWNKIESIWPSQSSISLSYNKKIGNAADVNLNLVLLLRKLNIDANPVVLSTRDNGVLPAYSVSFDKLNYVVVHAVIGDKTYLLDATDENLPIGMLPERTINGRGMVIRKESFEWVDLTPQKKDKYFSMLNLKLSPDGTMKGSWVKSSFDFNALNVRDEYKSFNSQDEYLKGIESDNLGLSIENYKLEGIDSVQKPVSEEFSIVLKNRSIKANNQLYVIPLQFDKYNENPFKAEERLYPVDFLTAMEKTQLLLLEMPDGYSIEQLPKNIRMVLLENAASFSMQSSIIENKVQVLFKLNINRPVFFQNEYLDLKAFFDELIKKQSEMLILKKV
jgi:hypothetical protein